MTKPKDPLTYNVSLRLPQSAAWSLPEEAAKRGLKPHEYIREIVMDALVKAQKGVRK